MHIFYNMRLLYAGMGTEKIITSLFFVFFAEKYADGGEECAGHICGNCEQMLLSSGGEAGQYANVFFCFVRTRLFVVLERGVKRGNDILKARITAARRVKSPRRKTLL